MSDLDAVRAAIEPGAPSIAVGRDAEQPADEDHRHRRARRARPRGRRARRRRQHLRLARLQQPLALGADVVVHSTTKYLGGHSDVVGGALVLDDDELRREGRRSCSSRPARSPARWTRCSRSRGIKTLGVRMQRHSANAQARRRRASRRTPASSGSTTRACRSHPGHELAAGRCRASAGCSRSRSPAARARRARFAESTRLFQLAESLGGVESLVNYPAR